MASRAERIKNWLSRLNFRTGIIVLICSAACYVVSFAQMALPISLEWKSLLWILFFGLAKALQYSGLLILGGDGIRRLKKYFRKNKD